MAFFSFSSLGIVPVCIVLWCISKFMLFYLEISYQYFYPGYFIFKNNNIIKLVNSPNTIGIVLSMVELYFLVLSQRLKFIFRIEYFHEAEHGDTAFVFIVAFMSNIL